MICKISTWRCILKSLSIKVLYDRFIVLWKYVYFNVHWTRAHIHKYVFVVYLKMSNTFYYWIIRDARGFGNKLPVLFDMERYTSAQNFELKKNYYVTF